MQEVEKLRQVLGDIARVDSGILFVDLDPAALARELKGNVDGLDAYLEFLDEFASVREAKAAKLAEQAASIRARVDALHAAILKHMQEHQYERLPGDERSIVRRRHHDPRVVVAREPSPEDALALGDLVRVKPRTYSWDKMAIKELAASERLPEPLKGLVSLKYSEKIEFEDRALLEAKEKL